MRAQQQIVWTLAAFLVLFSAAAFSNGLKSGPPLPHKLVRDWAKLPKG